MIAKKILIAAAALLALSSCKSGVPASSDISELKPTQSERDSVSYLLGTAFGNYIKSYNIGSMQDLDIDRIKAGIEDFLSAKNLSATPGFDEEFEISPKEMNPVLERYLAKRYNFVKAKNLEQESGYLREMEKAGFKKTESGLLYSITVPGTEAKIKDLDTVVVNYTGYCPDGSVFAQAPAGLDSLATAVKEGGLVSKGWVEGLKLIGEGGQITLVIPSVLAYGDTGRRRVEPNLPVRVDIEVLSVKPYTEKE